MKDTSPDSSATWIFHLAAWVGVPLYIGLFYLHALGATWSNGGSSSVMNAFILWSPVVGLIAAVVAIRNNKRVGMRILVVPPLLFYLGVSSYMFTWVLKH